MRRIGNSPSLMDAADIFDISEILTDIAVGVSE